MNSTAMTTAARVDFPREKMIYVTFGGTEEYRILAGDAAVGTNVMANAVPGTDYPLVHGHQEGGLLRGYRQQSGTFRWQRHGQIHDAQIHLDNDRGRTKQGHHGVDALSGPTH